jgi:hypothetical protein
MPVKVTLDTCSIIIVSYAFHTLMLVLHAQINIYIYFFMIMILTHNVLIKHC